MRELITRLASALGEDDYAAVRQIATEALHGAPSGRDAKALVAALLLPCSEYGPAEVPFLDALCGALEDASAYLQVSGSKKLSIELGGTDNGTADAVAYLLALLHSLPVDGLEAAGKGFTWMAKWACDAQGVLQTASYEPLDEGQKIDPKADEKLRRKVLKENKAFLNTPVRGLVDALPADLPMGLVNAVGLDQILGHTYAELIGHVAALPDQTGHDFRLGIHGQALTTRDLDDQLRIEVWNAPGNKQSLELFLRAELSETRMHKHFTDLLREVGYNKDLSDIGVFNWESSGINMKVRLHDWMFELRVIRHAQPG
ncbi:hypothetical protein J2X15_003006 [Rhodoferax saidenbachensis]|uniref:Uncharacterized protein n=1 Tax=Rhodoferax saidenbachensis TaxID=1484693 RepID=A0ABU1ZQA1_9BURK|nr:hypothetical protein [Rhodoferax saidenbachensis]